MKNYIKRLNEWKASQESALRGEQLILDLHLIEAEEGKNVNAEIEACKAQIAKREAYIAEIKSQIAAARLKMAA